MSVNIDKAEIQAIVELCWEVACNAEFGDVPKHIQKMSNIEGMSINLIRYDTYRSLLSALIPHSADVTHKRDKEPWEEP